MKTRNEGNRVGRPLFFDRSTTVIGGLGHHVETRNRKPAGTSMAACVLPICSARQRETSVILSFFFSREPSLYTVTHFPIRAFANSTPPVELSSLSDSPSSSLVQVIRDIPRNLRRFCCTGLSPRAERFAFRAASRCCFAFVSENCTA